MAPELINGSHDLLKVDTFALAVVLINLLTADFAFKTMDQYSRFIEEPRLTVEETNQKEMEELIALLGSMLASDPSVRLPLASIPNHPYF